VKECVVCKARPQELLKCSACMAVRYCSAECQKAHWKKHRKRCKELKAAAAEAAGGAGEREL
jgi:MYND finger